MTQIVAAGNEASDVQSLAKVVVDHIIDLTQFDVGTLCLLNKAESITELQYAGGGLSSTYVSTRARLSIDELHLVTVYHDCQPLLPEHATMPSDVLEYEHMETAAAFPITVQGEVIGHIGIACAEKCTLTNEETTLLTAIGQEIGSTIYRMQVEASVKAHAHRTAVLNGIIRVSNEATDIASLAKLLVDRTLKESTLQLWHLFL